VGTFQKQTVWGHRGAERCHRGDSLYFAAQAEYVDPNVGMLGQKMLVNRGVSFTPGHTSIDTYRHGKYPPANPATPYQFSPTGGQVSFNILYVDGHVGHSTDRTQAFRALRMRYPQ
jgi:prepilin-type processing-associated H-X9-DG protein